MSYPKILVEKEYHHSTILEHTPSDHCDICEILEMAKEFYDDLKKVKYVLNSGDKKMIKLLPKAIDEVIEKYPEKTKKWIDSDGFRDLAQSLRGVQPHEQWDKRFEKFVTAIKENHKPKE